MNAKILQLSDLHVGKSKSESKNLKRIVKKVVESFSKVKLTILLTGDIVDDGQKKQYKETANILKPLLKGDWQACNSTFTLSYARQSIRI